MSIMQAQSCTEECETAGMSIRHGIDARMLHSQFDAGSFNRIIFNFPHTGTQTEASNRAMLRDFLKSASYAAVSQENVFLY